LTFSAGQAIMSLSEMGAKNMVSTVHFCCFLFDKNIKILDYFTYWEVLDATQLLILGE